MSFLHYFFVLLLAAATIVQSRPAPAATITNDVKTMHLTDNFLSHHLRPTLINAIAAAAVTISGNDRLAAMIMAFTSTIGNISTKAVTSTPESLNFTTVTIILPTTTPDLLQEMSHAATIDAEEDHQNPIDPSLRRIMSKGKPAPVPKWDDAVATREQIVTMVKQVSFDKERLEDVNADLRKFGLKTDKILLKEKSYYEDRLKKHEEAIVKAKVKLEQQEGGIK